MLKIIVNGKEEITTENITLLNFIYSKKLNPDRIIIEHNLKVIYKNEWDTLILKNHDTLEILSLVTGG